MQHIALVMRTFPASGPQHKEDSYTVRQSPCHIPQQNNLDTAKQQQKWEIISFQKRTSQKKIPSLAPLKAAFQLVSKQSN